MRPGKETFATFVVMLAVIALPGHAFGQDLEPRRWTAIPPGINMAGAGAVLTSGDILFDPALEIEDATVEAETIALSYVRSFRIGSKLARFDVVVPWQHSTYAGLLQGAPASTTRVGLMDPKFRWSIILAGETPDPSAKSNTVFGAAVAVIAPFGEYHEEKLINLGQNRWVFQPQLGFVHTRGQWSYELTGSVYLFTDNDEFYGDSTREQDPLLTIQGHVIHNFKNPAYWAALSAGYGGNGRSIIDTNQIDDERKQFVAALSFGFPIGDRQGMKIALVRSRTNTSKGSDTDSLAIGWVRRF